MVERRRLRARRGYSGDAAERSNTNAAAATTGLAGLQERLETLPSSPKLQIFFFFDPGWGSVRSQAPALFGVLPPLGCRASWLAEAGAKPGGCRASRAINPARLPPCLRVSASPRSPRHACMRTLQAPSPSEAHRPAWGSRSARAWRSEWWWRGGTAAALAGAAAKALPGPAASPSCAPSSRPPLATSLGPSFFSCCRLRRAPTGRAGLGDARCVCGDAAPRIPLSPRPAGKKKKKEGAGTGERVWGGW